MPDFSHVTEKLLVGTCPKDLSDIDLLKANDVGYVVCLQSNVDFSANQIDWSIMEEGYLQKNIQVSRIAMIDFDEDNIATLLTRAASVVADAMGGSAKVYLHCTAGRERSPTVAAAWMMLHHQLTAEEAYAKMVAARPSNPYLFMLKSLEQSL